jgi:hypothetical protein
VNLSFCLTLFLCRETHVSVEALLQCKMLLKVPVSHFSAFAFVDSGLSVITPDVVLHWINTPFSPGRILSDESCIERLFCVAELHSDATHLAQACEKSVVVQGPKRFQVFSFATVHNSSQKLALKLLQQSKFKDCALGEPLMKQLADFVKQYGV